MPKLKLGDIFAIRLNQGRYCYGQVVSEGRISDCMIVYDLVSMEHPTVSEITSKPIIFLIQTVNSRIEDGIWNVIGNGPIPSMTFPLYKVETEDGYMLVDHKGDVVNEDPSASEIEEVPELESWSPVSLEKAANARFITGEWDTYYNELIYTN
ncbi:MULTISPECIES: Imm26 family immunity protein [unclassified Paenibacillus]|uniref:Imm26 family immunity protein n=1 Tax=unclassified Paenibacillus TaxID=185978 RepID=UPI0009A74A9C|nr:MULTISPECIES: Imm26 family immunity protein [unclassified Paenibacillus]SLJ88452.1 Immunity protein 26 [Paenibacillus sp. RU5A]SOC63656.1 Immunity protein 26 [Paenibacillus sp. RU26A]SOC68548.1 Immunity protein 26 [Paenibacillus sp. RU5M]